MAKDEEPENTAAFYATKPKSFLVGGSGWQSTALHSGGRYVPKGGFVVDFTTRGRYANEINDKWAGKRVDTEKSNGELSSNRRELEKGFVSSGNSGSDSSVVESESWADRIVLRHTQDVLYELSPPLETGIAPSIALRGQNPDAKLDEKSSSVDFKRKDFIVAAGKERQHTSLPKHSNNLEHSHQAEKKSWRPPGPCTPPRSSAANAILNHRRNIPNYGKIKQAGKRNNPSSAAPHDCTKCVCCAEVRLRLEETEAASRQDKAAAAHLRRRLEQEMAKIIKDRRDFEAFKEEEMKNIRAAAEEASRKQHRDRLAKGARQRAATKDSYLQDKAEIESLKVELEAERREAGKEAGRHRMEVERLRRKISRMEVEISELSAGMKVAEKDRLHAWEEAQRFKDLASSKTMTWPTNQNNNINNKSCSLEICSSSVRAVIGGSPGLNSSYCGDLDAMDSTKNSALCLEASDSVCCDSPATWSSSAAAEPAAGEKEDSTAEDENYNFTSHSNASLTEGAETTHASCIKKQKEPAVKLFSPKPKESKQDLVKPEIVRYPNGTIQRMWLDGHISTTFINGDIKQELPSGRIEYFFKEVSVWQVSHPSGIETFYFPNGRVESHFFATGKEGCCEKETLLPGGAGALHSFVGGENGREGRQLPVKVSSLRKETLLPRPVPIQSRKKF